VINSILNIVLLDATRTSGAMKQIGKTMDKINDDVGKLKDDVGKIKDDVGKIKDDAGKIKDGVVEIACSCQCSATPSFL
jgi:archaellum component FlaC